MSYLFRSDGVNVEEEAEVSILQDRFDLILFCSLSSVDKNGNRFLSWFQKKASKTASQIQALHSFSTPLLVLSFWLTDRTNEASHLFASLLAVASRKLAMQYVPQ